MIFMGFLHSIFRCIKIDENYIERFGLEDFKSKMLNISKIILDEKVRITKDSEFMDFFEEWLSKEDEDGSDGYDEYLFSLNELKYIMSKLFKK